MRLEKQIDEEPFDRRAVMTNLVAAQSLALGRGVLQPIERALAGQRRRRLGLALELAEQHAHDRIAEQQGPGVRRHHSAVKPYLNT